MKFVEKICLNCEIKFQISELRLKHKNTGKFCCINCKNDYKNAPLEERFYRFISESKTEKGCILWLGTTDSYGYGKIKDLNTGKKLKAHRVAWELKYGPIPYELCVLHKCDNPPCINWQHLFLGTSTDNHKDMMDKNKNYSPLGENNGKSKFTNYEVNLIRQEYATNIFTYQELANKYNVSKSTINSIVNYKTYLGEL